MKMQYFRVVDAGLGSRDGLATPDARVLEPERAGLCTRALGSTAFQIHASLYFLDSTGN